jgi:hypothetical protein
MLPKFFVFKCTFAKTLIPWKVMGALDVHKMEVLVYVDCIICKNKSA